MKVALREFVEGVLRMLPVSRQAHSRLLARHHELEAQLRSRDLRPSRNEAGSPRLDLGAVTQVEKCEPGDLEQGIPIMRTLEERVEMATRCSDANVLPKLPNAGAVVTMPDGTAVQIMHNGLKVVAGGYYGAWMQELISRCNGIHEPQEEVLFAEIIKHLPNDATMFELGGFWSYYSIWFLMDHPERRSFVVEPDPAHLAVGRINASLNNCAPHFISAFVGGRASPPAKFPTEASGTIDLPGVSVPGMIETYGVDRLDLLHCDAQGVELAVLSSCLDSAAASRLSWVVVSTHSHHISNDPLTHQRCLSLLRRAGARIVAEHDVQESFTGDGLIVAKFGEMPDGWQTPHLTYNRYSESLFRNPLYDLASARGPNNGT